MNIFEQYGIREVADVTLYGITTNKYGEKIYIPVLHFDTLKVSGLEQTSEQTTARGGLGNTEHILWNHGKTVTFNLEDAVYTPASQSLMWGGLYGLSKIKIKGRWNPYLYNNQNGYSLKRVKKEEESQMLEDFGVNDIQELEKGKDYAEVYLPCEEAEGYVYIKPEVKELKYKLKNEEPIQLKKNNIPVRIQYSDEEDKGENRKELYIYDTQWFAHTAKENLESIELQINNYENFQNKMILAKNQNTLNQDLIDNPQNYEEAINILNDVKNKPLAVNSRGEALYIEWDNFSTTEGERIEEGKRIQPICYFIDHNIGTAAREKWNIIKNNFGKYFRFGQYRTSQHSQEPNDIYELVTVFLKDDSISLNDNSYIITSEDIAIDFRIHINKKQIEANPFRGGGYSFNSDTTTFNSQQLIIDTNIEWLLPDNLIQKEPIHEYQWKNCNISLVSPKNNYTNIAIEDNINLCYHTLDNNTNKRFFFYDQSNKLPWHSKETFYTTVSCRITDINGDEQILSQRIPLGDFYIVEDESLSTPTLSNFINSINSGIENRKILEHFENLTASQRFAIDVDKNIKSYNLSQLPEYDRTNLTVYYNPRTMLPYEANDYSFTKANGAQLKEGNYAVIEKGDQYYKWSRTIADKGTALGQTVNITKNNFPFNFKLVGETYIRDRYQEDSHYQIELYNCAILDSININLAASGEPNIVNIKMKALTDQCGDIGRLTIYSQKSCNKVRSAAQQKQQQTYIPIDILEKIPELITESDYEIRILHPINNTIYCLEKDCAIPDKGEFSYLKLYVPNKDDTSWKGKTYYEYYDYIKDTLNKEDLLIVKIDNNDIIQGFVTKDDIKYDFSRDEEVAP